MKREEQIKAIEPFRFDDSFAVIEFARWAIKERGYIDEKYNENITLDEIWDDALDFCVSGYADFEEWFLDREKTRKVTKR